MTQAMPLLDGKVAIISGAASPPSGSRGRACPNRTPHSCGESVRWRRSQPEAEARFVGLDDRAGRGNAFVLCEAEEQFGARHQHDGFGPGGKDQELLVVGVAATRQIELLFRFGRHNGGESEVTCEKCRLSFRGEPEFGVGEDTFQLTQAFRIGQRF